jgi:hypothetical protein
MSAEGVVAAVVNVLWNSRPQRSAATSVQQPPARRRSPAGQRKGSTNDGLISPGRYRNLGDSTTAAELPLGPVGAPPAIPGRAGSRVKAFPHIPAVVGWGAKRSGKVPAGTMTCSRSDRHDRTRATDVTGRPHAHDRRHLPPR